MITIDPVEFDNFTMSQVSDNENDFQSVVAISNSSNGAIPLIEIKFQKFNSINQQIDATKKYAYSNDIKYRYAGVKYKAGSITVNIDDDTNMITMSSALCNYLNNQFKDQIHVYTLYNNEDFYYHLLNSCDQMIEVDHQQYAKSQAKGAFYSARAIQQYMYSNKSYQHKHVVVQGLGSVGSETAKLFDKNNANLTVCDQNKENINQLYADAYFGTCTMDQSYTIMCDVLVLCGDTDSLDKNSTLNMNCLAVLGVEDGQLASNKAGYNMHTQKIPYVPDYVAGVGGLLMIIKQLENQNKSLEKDLDKIFTRTLSLLNHSNKLRKPPFIVAEQQLQEKQKIKQSA